MSWTLRRYFHIYRGAFHHSYSKKYKWLFRKSEFMNLLPDKTLVDAGWLQCALKYMLILG
jgi:hypothetical protein